MWLLLGYIATANVKSDVIFLLGDPDFLLGRRNFAPISLSYRDPHFGLFGGLGIFWGYLATSGEKSDVRFIKIDHVLHIIFLSCINYRHRPELYYRNLSLRLWKYFITSRDSSQLDHQCLPLITDASSSLVLSTCIKQDITYNIMHLS